MKIKELLERVNSLKENNYTTQQKIDWINNVELYVSTNIKKEFGIYEIDIQAGVNEYSLPNIITPVYITDCYINGEEAQRINYSEVINDTTKIQYCINGNKIYITPKPVCDSTKGLSIVYISLPNKYTVSDVDKDLLVVDPYSELYIYYLYAMMDLYNNDYQSYNANIALYNNLLNEYSYLINKSGNTNTYKIYNFW